MGRGLRDMDHSDLANSGFWVGHIMMIVATIVGVYLAAHAGLQQALAFDQIQTLEDNYFLRRSLHAELADNVDSLQRYVDEDLRRVATQDLQRRRPRFDRFVWETMRYSPTTLETPSQFLTGARRFYTRTETLLDKIGRRELGVDFAKEQLRKEIAIMRDGLLPSLEASFLALEAQLADLGAPVDSQREAAR